MSTTCSALGQLTSLVLGGTDGIGLGIATELSKRGSKVTVLGRDEEKARRALSQLHGSANEFLQCDLLDFDSVRLTFDRIQSFDVVVLNPPGPAPDTVLELTTNHLLNSLYKVMSSIACIVDQTLPSMKRSGYGRYIGITSSSIISPIDNLASSSMMRAAFTTYLKLLANATAQDGVTVNHIVPGKIDTARLRRVEAQRSGSEDATPSPCGRISPSAEIPLGRYGSPTEVGALAAFLASPAASYITGSALRCDGGFNTSL